MKKRFDHAFDETGYNDDGEMHGAIYRRQDEGWELVTVTYAGSKYRLFWKRPVES